MSVIGALLSLKKPRRRTRTYDKADALDLVGYLESYMSPVGTIISKLSNNTPGDAWLLVSGQSLSKADYADLYADIGGTFGETATTFNLPDLSDTYLTGAGTLGVGATGGSNNFTLSVSQMPSHAHPVVDAGHTHAFNGIAHNHTVTDPGHTHTTGLDAGAAGAAGATVDIAVAGSTGSSTTGVTVDNATASGSNSTEQTGVTIGNSGGVTPVDNRPASIGVYHFIKTRL